MKRKIKRPRWSQNQIWFASALRNEWQLRSQIATQARDNGHVIYRVNWADIVAAGIAAARRTKSSNPELCRGPHWHKFFDDHGSSETMQGLAGIETGRIVAEIFAPSKAIVLPFRGRK